jgi:predicted extracellular nuclease
VCANAATVFDCDLDVTPDTNLIQNGAPDAVALTSGLTIIDAVSYEGDTGAGYTEGSGSGLTDDSGQPSFGISRFPDGVDTEVNNVDLSGRCITPGAPNGSTSAECPTPGPPTIVINEIDYDQPGTDSAEFLEIKNVGSSTVTLGGTAIQLVNGSGASVYNTIDLPDQNLAPGEYFVICANALTVDNCDLDASPDTNFIQNGSPDAAALIFLPSAEIVDTVSYEGDTAAPYTEGSGVGLADSSEPDEGISRCPDGTDTDQNDVDLTTAAITPGAMNSCQPAAGSGLLVINEVDYDQPGTDFAEFVEIKNVDVVAVNLGLFTLQLINGNGGTLYQSFPLPVVNLAPGDYFVVCGNAGSVFNCDLDVSPDSNLVQNGAPDAVALFEGSVLVDVVSYEGDTAAPFTEGSGSGLEDPSFGGVGGENENKGISRLPDGADTDMNNVDFSTTCITPGTENVADNSECPLPGPPLLVINEIDYDQPGSDAAEFVEIFNAGTVEIDLTGIDLILVNGSGGGAAIYNTITLPSTVLSADEYFVICANAATVLNCDLDASPSTNFLQNGSPDAVALVRGELLIDTISYEGDTGAPYTESTGSGLVDSGSTGEDFKGISRIPNGIDSGANSADLANVCITPGRANTSLDRGCTAGAPLVEVFEIQGSGLTSPLESQTVKTPNNSVTAVGIDGFFVQTPTDRTDADSNTSDGVFVFTGSPVPPVSVGDRVDVTGQVSEFFGFTEIGGAPLVEALGTGTSPEALVFDSSRPSPDPTTPSCATGLVNIEDQLECFEGMLVQIINGSVTGSNLRFGTDPIAEIRITAAERAFREPGIEFPGLAGLPVWDGNPEIFELDPDKLGLPNQIIPAGSSFDTLGVVGFEFGDYEIWPSDLEVRLAELPVSVRARGAYEMTVGTLNLFRLFDDVDDPADTRFDGETRDDTVVSSDEYARRLAKFASYIVDVLHNPDILAVQEAEKLGVLQDLAVEIALLDPSVSYSAYLVEGNDRGTIDIGFLTRETVVVDTVTQLGAMELLSTDGSPLHDRPPLLIQARCTADGANFPISVMGVHNRSLGGIENPTDGDRVRQKRFEQAESIATKVQALQAAQPSIYLVVTGDFNAFEFTDGYVDAVGHIRGHFDPLDELICSTNTCDDLVDPDLSNQVSSLPGESRYSFNFQGSNQVLDHALTSQALDPLGRGFEYGRGNSDAALALIDDAGTALRSSDHDGGVLFIFKDSDQDSVPDSLDVCSDTTIPESVPLITLGVNRYALVDDDEIFDTLKPKGRGPQVTFAIEDTAGCSCEQIVDALGLGKGHKKYGCSIGVMRTWVELVSPGDHPLM